MSMNVKKTLKGLSVTWLSGKAQIPESLLWRLSRDSSEMYNPSRKQPKSSGTGYRIIDPPKKEYKRLLKRINKTLSRHIKHHPAAHGGVPGRSSFTSASPHCGKKFTATRDIKDCYPSVATHKLCNAFRKLGASPCFADFLSGIMTVYNRIPQGGPLSSLALNLFMMQMDNHFYQKARVRGGKFGRLSDDFVFSSNNRNVAMQFEKEIDHAIRQRGLDVNSKKAEKKGFLAGDKIKVIHSLVVNNKRGLKPKDEHIQKGIFLAQQYARCCKCATPKDLLYLADLRARTAGMMYYMRQAKFSPANHIRKVIENADDKVSRMLQSKGLQPCKNKWWLQHQKQNEPKRLMGLWLEKTR